MNPPDFKKHLVVESSVVPWFSIFII